MAETEGNLRGVLNCVETLVKNIRRRRDLILKTIGGKQCVSTTQLSILLNTFVDQILDDNSKVSEESMAQMFCDEPHKDMAAANNGHKLAEKELKQRIQSLENSLKKESEDKQRIQKHCSKIMEKCQTNEDNHKTQIQELNQSIETLTKSESELKARISDLMNRSNFKPKFDPLIEAVKCEVKRELLARSVIMKEESQTKIEEVVDTYDKDYNDMNSESETEEESYSERLRNKCLASNVSISLGQRVDIIEFVAEDEKEDTEANGYSEDESVVDITQSDYPKKRGRSRGRPSANRLPSNMSKDGKSPMPNSKKEMSYFKTGKGKHLKYHCNSPNCSFKCRFTTDMLDHLFFCNPERVPNFTCFYCSKKFLLRAGLQKHINGKHKGSHRFSTPTTDTFKRKLRSIRRLSYVQK